MNGKPYTSEEDSVIINSADKTAKEIALLIGRTERGVASRRIALGIRIKREVEIGKVYGRLTAVEISDRTNKGKSRFVICKCQCGNICEVRATLLTNINTVSCGCYKKERLLETNLIAPGEASFNAMEGQYIKRARKKNWTWELTKEQFREIALKNCFWCNREPSPRNVYSSSNMSRFISDRGWIKVNGIDRIDSNKGYEIKNCVPCCIECNLSKSNKTAKEFFEHCKRVVDNLSKKIKI